MFTPSERPERLISGEGGNNAAADSPQSPTLTHYQEVSDRVQALLDEAVSLIPTFQIKHPTTTKFVHGHLNVPMSFLEKVVAGVAKKTSLQAFNKLDVTFSIDTLQLNSAFRPVVDKLFNLARNLKYTLDSRVAIVTADSLQVYYLVKGLGRDPDGADMLQFAEDLKRELKRPGPKKAVKPALLPATEAAAEPADGALQRKRPSEEVITVTKS
jgi:hypothetical protein